MGHVLAEGLQRIEGVRRHGRALFAGVAWIACVGCVVTAGPAVAAASAPVVATDGAHASGATSAVVDGNVDPEGQSTTLRVDYGPAGGVWCVSGGAQGAPLAGTTPETIGSLNGMISEVTVTVEGLTASTEYCAELVATNATGSTSGGQRTFTTTPQAASAPVVATDGAHASGATSAVVDGNVDPEGQSTTLRVDYGPAGGVWCVSGGAQGAPLAGTTPETIGSLNGMISEVTVTVEGLTASTEYCAELVATNATGSTSGGQRTFTTTPQAASAPVVATDGAHASGATSAVVDGNVDPEGQSTTLRVDYGPAGGVWCVSGGAQGAPLAGTTPETIGSLNGMISEVTVTVEGLTASTEYCAELVATNATGSTSGGQRTFTTTPQAVGTGTTPLSSSLTGSATTPFEDLLEVLALRPSSSASSSTASVRAQEARAARKLARALKACHRWPKSRQALCARHARRSYHAAIEAATSHANGHAG